MAKKMQQAVTHRDIIEAVRRREFAPVYLLMGEESYYIDRVSDFIADNVLTEDEKGFNQQIIYCTRETNVADIINSAKRYPMMSEFQVVIVKEAQNLLKLEELSYYVLNPLKSTILVICYKNGSIDKRKKIVAAIEKEGVVFESKKVKEGQLSVFITEYLKRKNIAIDDRAAFMLVESIGADLNRMASELDKLKLTLPPGFNRVTPELVEKNVGISKDFNNWELRNALVEKNVYKANQIINYFAENPKANPSVMTLTVLFNFFSNLMVAYYAPDKTEQGMCEHLELKSPWQLKEYKLAMQNYSAMKTLLVIGKIRETDAKLKGVGRGNASDLDIMKELIYYIMH
jgi:DNA polymerase-3 subunit delta